MAETVSYPPKSILYFLRDKTGALASLTADWIKVSFVCILWLSFGLWNTSRNGVWYFSGILKVGESPLFSSSSIPFPEYGYESWSSGSLIAQWWVPQNKKGEKLWTRDSLASWWCYRTAMPALYCSPYLWIFMWEKNKLICSSSHCCFVFFLSYEAVVTVTNTENQLQAPLPCPFFPTRVPTLKPTYLETLEPLF